MQGARTPPAAKAAPRCALRFRRGPTDARRFAVLLACWCLSSGLQAGYLENGPPPPLLWVAIDPSLYWKAMAKLPPLDRGEAPTKPESPTPDVDPALAAVTASTNASPVEATNAPAALFSSEAAVQELLEKLLRVAEGSNAPAPHNLPLEFVPPRPSSSATFTRPKP